MTVVLGEKVNCSWETDKETPPDYSYRGESTLSTIVIRGEPLVENNIRAHGPQPTSD